MQDEVVRESKVPYISPARGRCVKRCRKQREPQAYTQPFNQRRGSSEKGTTRPL